MTVPRHILGAVAVTLVAFVSVNDLRGASNALAREGQLGVPIQWIQVPDTKDQFYMAQRTTDGKLLLTPNESFFPKLGLRAGGKGKVPDTDRKLNGGASFESITQWNQGDQAEWGLWFEEVGDLKMRIWMSQTGTNSRYKLSLGDLEKTFSAGQTGEEPREVAVLPLRIRKPGRYSLIVTCGNEPRGAKSRLHRIEVAGPAAKNSAVLRKRWRPAAAHTRFSSSRNRNNVRLWIMEMDAKPGDLGFYSPITTPFGYYGPTWLASGVVNTSFNFSFWSYGRGQPEPPIERLSHLIAIGNPTAKFGGFGHEGTGVKIRDWQPLAGRQGQRQTIALRVQPGQEYDTYFSYFFANDDQHWHLLGVGKKYNKHRPLKTLTVGSFVEVPGRPSSQRTGAYVRRMRYRGWTVDTGGKLFPIDRMSHGDIDKSTGLTYTDRGLTEDGWFYLQTGGWVFRKIMDKGEVSAPPRQNAPRVAYLDPEDLSFLQTVPCEITGKKVRRTAAGPIVTFTIRNLGENPEVNIFWGNKEGLTFADRWTNKGTVSNLREGDNQFMLKNMPVGSRVFVRLFLKNQEGQFWSMNTLKMISR